MKKILLIVILLLGLGGAGAGYYLFFMKPAQETEVAKMKDDTKDSKDTGSEAQPNQPAPFLVKDYYAKERKVAVRNGPGESFLPERYLYIGDGVTVMEEKDGWGRISGYYVYKQGGKEMAEWVKMAHLAHVKPVINEQEQEEIISSYIHASDDFKDYREKFIHVTEKLLTEKICEPEDFEELKGWMKSLNYPDRNVYFVYCGGLNVSDKVYFDVDSEEVFYN
ncbi:hypothetical protein OAP63_01780 [Vibrio sp.]|nr:hypothetical protein [Vibrio sp.]